MIVSRCSCDVRHSVYICFLFGMLHLLMRSQVEEGCTYFWLCCCSKHHDHHPLVHSCFRSFHTKIHVALPHGGIAQISPRLTGMNWDGFFVKIITQLPVRQQAQKCIIASWNHDECAGIAPLTQGCGATDSRLIPGKCCVARDSFWFVCPVLLCH